MLASYRDPECSFTIHDLYGMSSGKYRINVGVVWQIRYEDRWMIQDLHRYKIKHKMVKANESLGCCWARSLAYSMYSGEDYVLSIDSHSRFVKNWDTLLIDILESLPQRSIVSTYPASYTPHGGRDKNAVPHTIVGGDIVHGIVVPRAVVCDHKVIEQYFVSCGFLFSSGYLFKQVPYDSQIYFNGEEPTLAARFWTHGWNMYSPGQVIVYHYYGREKQAKHWTDNDAKSLIDKSCKRVYNVLDGTCFDRFGLGTDRAYSEYCLLSGIKPRR